MEPLYCRHLGCVERATHQAVITTTAHLTLPRRVRKVVFYCADHLAKVAETVAANVYITMTNVQTIEEGTTVTEENPPSDAYRRGMENTIRAREAQIERLENDTTRQAQVLAARNQMITDLEHETSQQKATNNRLNEDLGKATSALADVVMLLHTLANEAEDAGRTVAADTIDETLDRHGLASRKKHFELVFTVPIQVRIEGDYPDKEAFREAFKAGRHDDNWTVGDYEETLDDDIEIVVIEEVPQ